MYWFFFFIPLYLLAHDPIALFIPPQNWQCCDPTSLSSEVKIAYIQPGHKTFAPSMNLATEPISVSDREYLQLVKKLHSQDKRSKVTDGVSVQTKSGKAHILDIETTTKAGPVRMMQMILVKENRAYVLTAACLKKEFNQHAQRIFRSFQTMQIENSLFHFLPERSKKTVLQEKLTALQGQIKNKDLLGKPPQLEKELEKFQQFLEKDFSYLGSYWQFLMLREATTI